MEVLRAQRNELIRQISTMSNELRTQRIWLRATQDYVEYERHVNLDKTKRTTGTNLERIVGYGPSLRSGWAKIGRITGKGLPVGSTKNSYRSIGFNKKHAKDSTTANTTTATTTIAPATRRIVLVPSFTISVHRVQWSVTPIINNNSIPEGCLLRLCGRLEGECSFRI